VPREQRLASSLQPNKTYDVALLQADLMQHVAELPMAPDPTANAHAFADGSPAHPNIVAP
jgi:hypothetical protein